MPSLSLPGRLIWFAHCPKAGGTSVERFMVDHWGGAVGHLHWGWDLWWKGGGWRVADPPNSPQHLIWEDAQRAFPKAPDTVFAVVRDPLSRIISEYHYQRRARRGTGTGRAIAHLPFGVWLRLMLMLARQNPYAFDNHLRPQGDFVPRTARVFRLEAGLSAVARWLLAETGAHLRGEAPHELKQGGGSDIRLYSGDIRLIRTAFAEDYARFGYAPPDPAGYPDDRFGAVKAIVAQSFLPFVVRLERCGKL